MKWLMTILLFFSVLMKISAQDYNTTRTPRYEMPTELMKEALEKRQARYDKNRKYLDQLLDWTLKLKSYASNHNASQLYNEIDKWYERLRNLEDTDLSKKRDELKFIEYEIKDVVNEYENKDPSQKANNKQNKKLKNTYNQALRHYENREFDKAIPLFSKLLQHKEDPDLYSLRGDAYFYTKRYKEAIRDYKEVLKIHPNQKYSLIQLCWSYNYSEEYQSAIQTANKIINKHSDSYRGYFCRGYAKSGLKDYYGSTKDYNKSIKLNPDHSMSYNNIGWNYYEQGDLDKALVYVNKALEKNSSNAFALDSKAEIYLDQDKLKKAIKYSSKALNHNPDKANSYLIRGKAKYQLGRQEEACIDWSKAGEKGAEEAYDLIQNKCNN